MRLVILSVVFNVFWLTAVAGGSQWWPVLAVCLVVAVILDPKLLWLAPILSVFGLFSDFVLTLVGVIDFGMRGLPLWLVFLWLGFTAYIWLIRETIFSANRIVICALAGVGGALSYFAGVKLGAADLPMGTFGSLAVILVLWVVHGAVLNALMRWFDAIYPASEVTE